MARRDPPDGDPAADDPPGGDADDRAPRSPARWALWIAVGLVAVAALGYGAILIYANFVNDPADELTADDLRERLTSPTTDGPDTDPPGTDPSGTDPPGTDPSLPDATGPADAPPPATAPADDGPAPPLTTLVTDATADGPIDVDGTWLATSDSELGYRVTEILFGVDTEGVGRTNAVTGTLEIDGTRVTEASFEVDMATVESDDSRRDGQFRGRIMSVVDHPTSTFVLTEPIELGEIPAPGEQITATATGDLTLRGVTNQVTFDVVAELAGERIGVLGTIPVVFADYDIVNPSIAGITTEDEGVLEFVLVFAR